MDKITYRVRNWKQYNQALVNRGNLTVWLDQELIDSWQASLKSGRPGRPATFEPSALRFCLLLRTLLRLPYRQTQGFIEGLMRLMGSDLDVPSYSYLCKSALKLEVKLDTLPAGAREIAVDASGLKVFGEGEWKVRTHGKDKRRTWKKIHIAVDTDTREITACILTDSNVHDSQEFRSLLKQSGRCNKVFGDGAYDSADVHQAAIEQGGITIVPPRATAVASVDLETKNPKNPRDELILLQEVLGEDWRKAVGYGKRNHSECVFSRLKRIFGDKLTARGHMRQLRECLQKVAILNRFSRMGLPIAVPTR